LGIPSVPGPPSARLSNTIYAVRIFQTIKGYIFWTYERGSLHYDVMVTLILLFIFLSPRYIDFRDKPPTRIQHQIGVIVNLEGQDGYYVQVDAATVGKMHAADTTDALMKVIAPILGDVQLQGYQTIQDEHGNVRAYGVKVKKH
jgi:hypothetical protein